MARGKFGRYARRSVRRVARFGRSQFRRPSKSGGLKSMDIVLGGALYGAGRSLIAQAISPLTSKLPFGSLNDNVGLATVDVLGLKFLGGKAKILKGAFTAGLAVEAAQGTQELMAGTAFGSNSNSGSQTSYMGWS